MLIGQKATCDSIGSLGLLPCVLIIRPAVRSFFIPSTQLTLVTVNNILVSYNGENVDSILAPSFLIESSSYLRVTRTFIASRTSSKFGQIGPRIAELAALERLEKFP